MCTDAPNSALALLPAFLAGAEPARNLFPRFAERYILKLSRKLAPDLPDELHQDVANQTLENLLRQKPDAFDPSRGAPGTFLRLLVRNSVRQVRAGLAQPGSPTRVRKTILSAPMTPGTRVFKVMANTSLSELNKDDPILPSSDGGILRAEMRMDAATVLEAAPVGLRQALVRIFLEGDPMGDVARDLGISRFQLHREIAAFAEVFRRAA